MTDIPYESRRSPELLTRETSRLLIVDVQQKLVPHISVAESLIDNCRKLIRGSQVLDVPCTVTEQYPKGLGQTVDEISELIDDGPLEKVRFSCGEVLDWGTTPQGDERFQIVVAGIEAHVCVQQTVLDLIAAGLRVSVAADAVASQRKFDWQTALSRMADSGATITTTEAILFEWCAVAGTPEFQQISRIVTGRA